MCPVCEVACVKLRCEHMQAQPAPPTKAAAAPAVQPPGARSAQPGTGAPIQRAPPRAPPQPPEQLATRKLLNGPPPVPSVVSAFAPSKAEKKRRQLLLRAQDELAEISTWTRELFTAAGAASPLAPGSLNTAALCRMLEGRRTHAEEALAVDAEAHAKELRAVRDGSEQLAADLGKLKRAGSTCQVEDVLVTKRAREAADPGVKFMSVQASVFPAKASASALAAKLEPTSGVAYL